MNHSCNSSVVKPGDQWCICQDRYYEAYTNNKAPRVVYDSTNYFLKPHVKKAIFDDYRKNTFRKRKTKKMRAKLK